MQLLWYQIKFAGKRKLAMLYNWVGQLKLNYYEIT